MHDRHLLSHGKLSSASGRKQIQSVELNVYCVKLTCGFLGPPEVVR